jgi:hypothetical protein
MPVRVAAVAGTDVVSRLDAQLEALVVEPDVRAARRSEPPAWLPVIAFSVAAVVLTFPAVGQLRTHILGDQGDALLTLWVVRAAQHGLLHGWSSFWSPPIFFPTRGTFAYSDTLLPIALVHWPLRLLFGDVVAINLIALGSSVLSSWCVYRLAWRVCRSWHAPFVAALAYTYSAVRLAQLGHFQLLVGSALFPLVVLLMFRCLEAPSVRRGVALGVAFVAVTLTASYYGAIAGVAIVIVVGGYLLAMRPSPARSHVLAIGSAAAVVAVVMVPVGLQYAHLQKDPAFRRGFDPATSAHRNDFLASVPDNYVLSHVPQIAPRSTPNSRSGERRLFPGLVTLAFAVTGAIVLAREGRRRGWRRGRVLEVGLLLAVGAVSIVLAVGDQVAVFHHVVTMPFHFLRRFVPGFAGIRATARLALGGQLALALLAAVGIDALVQQRRAAARVALTAALAGFVLLEAAAPVGTVRVPTAADDGGVAQALRARPRGPVVELPIYSMTSGLPWPYVEAPRQLEALRDGRPRVNGYSGFQPKNFDQVRAKLDGFPDPSALYEARRLGVRYIVLRTKLIGPTPAYLVPFLGPPGVGRYSDATARNMLEQLPRDAVVRVDHLPGAYLIELRQT